MDKSIQRIINKIIKYGNEEWREVCKELAKKQFEISKISKSIYLRYFNQIDFDKDNFKEKENKADIIFLDSLKVFETLNEIYASISDKVAFLEWYLEGFSSFYTTKSIEYYQELATKFVREIEESLAKEKKNYLIETNETYRVKKSFLKSKEIAEQMQFLKNLGISYAEQHQALKKLGMPESLMNQITMHYIASLESPKNSDKKNELNTKSEKDIQESSNELDPKTQENVQESSNQFLEDVISKRSLKDLLNSYFNLQTLSNVVIIEGEIFEKVDSWLKQIFSPSKVIFIENIILSNNEDMKRDLRISTMSELLNEEDNNLMKEATEFLHDDYGRDPMFNPYITVVQHVVDEVNEYVNSYISLNKEDKERLKEDYINLIHISLSSLDPHLDFLPFSYWTTRS